MALIKLNPKSSLNKAFLKVKPNRVEIEKFKSHLISLLDNINETESEEFHKNLISEFLKKTYYDPSYYINTKGRNDLVIHNGKEAKDSVAVIIEAKKPTNKAEMLKQENINTKAFQGWSSKIDGDKRIAINICIISYDIDNSIGSIFGEWSS